ncbi:DNA polymerase eta [Nematolebias whitei]|uniref:DNA polymerase eta n=1 Tax=Nematolebias whitei TaxID=451745 RepID=UPI00189B30C4|nr:DNA polymerase eta [Nematolebias whitei]
MGEGGPRRRGRVPDERAGPRGEGGSQKRGRAPEERAGPRGEGGSWMRGRVPEERTVPRGEGGPLRRGRVPEERAVQYWLHQLALELEERLTKDREANGRVAKLLTVGVRQLGDKRPSSFSRCCALVRYEATKLSSDSLAIIKSLNTAGNHQAAWTPPLTLLHLSASKFSDAPSAGGIAGFLSGGVTSTQSLFSSTQPPSDSKTGSACSQLGTIQSLFQKAALKQKQAKNSVEEEDDGASAEVLSPIIPDEAASESPLKAETNPPEYPFKSSSHTKKGSSSFRSGISFFQKIIERSSKVSTSTSTPEPGQEPGILHAGDHDDSVVVSALQSRPSSEVSPQAPSEEIKEEPEVESGVKSHPQSDDFVSCERCGLEVLVWKMPEHSDYHFALDLQKSLSSTNLSTASSSSSAAPSPLRLGGGAAQSSRAKTKTKGQSGPAAKRRRSQGGSVGTLDCFFKKNEKF